MKQLGFKHNEIFFKEQLPYCKIRIALDDLRVVDRWDSFSTHGSRHINELKGHFYKNDTNFYIDYCALLILSL